MLKSLGILFGDEEIEHPACGLSVPADHRGINGLGVRDDYRNWLVRTVLSKLKAFVGFVGSSLL